MSNSIKDGGPAFPGLQYSDEKGDVIVSYGSDGRAVAIPRGSFPGMSLRDYFAGQALSGLIANSYIEQQTNGHEDPQFQTVYAKFCYSMADAMLKEREK